METGVGVNPTVQIGVLIATPLSQGKPIEWKLDSTSSLARLLLLPSRRGNQLNGNLQATMMPIKKVFVTPLSQGKPIEWKPGHESGVVAAIDALPSRRGNQLNGNQDILLLANQNL